MRAFTYLMIDVGCFIIPFVFSFYPSQPFYKEWRYFFPANFIVAIFFLIWDGIFTSLDVWGFNPDYHIGLTLFRLPLEEILFFVAIPYATTFTYFALKYLLNPKYYHFDRSIFPVIGSVLLVFIIFFYHDKLYTFWTAIFLLIMLFLVLFRKININLVILSYITILPFFFLSNGILTGSFIDSPIVYYNDIENLGFRLGTIPVEDIFYGLLLALMNVLVYERIKTGSFQGK